ncbi:MAG: hypothetical protein PWP65_1648 [Clostridia bacterium]|nr:hypothetical protein [Clostridia bacterium]
MRSLSCRIAIILAALVFILAVVAGVVLGAENGPGTTADPAVARSYLEEVAGRRLGELEAQVALAKQKVEELQQTLAALQKMLE